MKNTALQICSVIGFAILIAVVSAQAQTQYRAHIPFDFTINQKSYEAGNYVIAMLSPDAGNKPIAFRDASGRNSRIIMVTPGDDYSKIEIATLVFSQVGTQYSLTVIRTPSFVVKFPKSKAAAKATLARNQNAQQTIVALTPKN